ncbi:MAG: IS1595 family transposase [Chloroflexi bacterium]|nr:IS1595 family transposase [Chloroflexota bacterium]
MNNEPKTLLEAIRYFSDPDVCLDFMVSLRWPDGVIACPNCGRDDVRFIPTRRIWECRSKHAKRQFSVKVGTIFEGSPIGLDKWLAAIWMISSAKNGVSSYEIARAIGITQKSAWFMLHRIRLAMQDGDFGGMSGEVEVDETYVGGKARFMHKSKRKEVIQGRGTAGKTAVMGLLERHGPDGHSAVNAKVIRSTGQDTLSGTIRRSVEPGTIVYTDEHAGYNAIGPNYTHEVINHAEEYVHGLVHTNGIENFWSLLKRAIKGTYISVEPFHLFRYVDEESFRYNSRKVSDGKRFNGVMKGVSGKRLTYKQLTGAVTA